MLLYINRRANQPLEIDYRDGTVIRLAPGEARKIDIHEGYLEHPVTEVYVKNKSLRVVQMPEPKPVPETPPVVVIEAEPEATQQEDGKQTELTQQTIIEVAPPTKRKRNSRKKKDE